MLFQRRPDLIKVVNFVKARSPKIVVVETKREKKDYQRFFYLAREVLLGIRSDIFFPRPSFMCKDCEYEALCKDWRGNHS